MKVQQEAEVLLMNYCGSLAKGSAMLCVEVSVLSQSGGVVNNAQPRGGVVYMYSVDEALRLAPYAAKIT